MAVIGLEASLYINGNLHVSATLDSAVKAHPLYTFRFLENTSLFRMGNSDNLNPIERFNGGRPLYYNATDAAIEFHTNGLTKDSFRENVSKQFYDNPYMDCVEIDDMYPREIISNMPPNVVPQFVRQRYFDQVENREYLALGRNVTNDWKKLPTYDDIAGKQDLLISGQTVKTINNVSLLGSGNVNVGDGGVSVQSKEFENITSYGANVSGIVDDTTAIETALEVAANTGNYLFFPKGNWLIKRGLKLKTGVQIIASREAVLTKNAAITQLLQANVSIGDTFAMVQDASAYEVGQECAILTDEISSGAGGHTSPTFGVINAINTSTNRIDFTPREGYAGAVANVAVGSRSYFTNDFSLITTNETIRTTNNVIDGLTIDRNARLTDPIYYFFGTIHTNRNSSKTTVQNCKIIGSNSDGISLQGDSEMIYRDNEIYDVKHNAMHFGTSCRRIDINNNLIVRAGLRGVFWCFNNHKIFVTKNHFIECYIGCGGLDNQDNLGDRDSIISKNTFENCTLYGVELGGFSINTSKNIFTKFQNNANPIYARGGNNFIVSKNIFREFNDNYTGDVMSFDSCDQATITTNNLRNLKAGTGIKINSIYGACTGLIISTNNIKGGQKGIDLKDLEDSIVDKNIVRVDDGGVPVTNINPTNVQINNLEKFL
jgi:hypothetical protein